MGSWGTPASLSDLVLALEPEAEVGAGRESLRKGSPRTHTPQGEQDSQQDLHLLSGLQKKSQHKAHIPS